MTNQNPTPPLPIETLTRLWAKLPPWARYLIAAALGYAAAQGLL